MIDEDNIYSLDTTKNAVGISPQFNSKYIPVGTNTTGQNIYSDPSKGRSEDTGSGFNYAKQFTGIYGGLGLLDSNHVKDIAKFGAVGADDTLHSTLSTHVQNKDPKAFVSSLNKTLGSNDSTNSKLSGLFLYSNWDSLSPAQRSLGITNAGIQGSTDLSGKKLLDSDIPNITEKGPSGMKAGSALALTAEGLNGYALGRKWDQITPITEIMTGKTGIKEGAAVATTLGLSGEGLTGTVLRDVTVDNLSKVGATPAPDYGVGAVTLQKGAQVPAGFRAISSKPDGTVIAAPNGMEHTSPVTPSTSAATSNAVQSISNGSNPIIKNWDKLNPTTQGVEIPFKVGQSAVNGVGGSAMIGGLNTLALSNAFLFSGIMGHSTMSGIVGGSKSSDQKGRDSIRSVISDAGLKDGIKLSDGTLAKLGVDGHGDIHTFRYSDKAVGDGGKSGLHAYDIDYTNDLDFFSGMGGIALSTILAGKSGDNVKQVGGQLGNQALGKVGFGKDMTPDNFNTVMQNMRGMYATAGIKSKEEGLALINKMYGAKQIDDTQHVQMQQSLNMVFDNDINLANRLSAGRFKGIAVAGKQNTTEAPKTEGTKPINAGKAVNGLTRDQIIANNRAKFKGGPIGLAANQLNEGVAA